jgi:hypothetical protein
MSLTNFNNIKAAEVQVVLDNIWAEPSTSKSYSVKAHTIKAILENQTAELKVLENPDQKRDFAIKWVDFCGDTSSDGSEADDCANTAGGEGAAKTETYALDIFIEDSYSVASEELEAAVVDYDQIVATGLSAKIRNMVENFNKKAVAVIAANKGVNPFPGNYAYDAVTKDTTISGADFGGEKLIPYFMQVAEMNRSRELYLLDGGNLFQDYYVATKNSLNADGKTANTMYSDFSFRHDMAGFAANDINNETFLIDKGSLAIANRAKYPELSKLASLPDGGWIHMSTGSMMRYSIPVNIPDFLPMMFIQQGKLAKQALMIDVQHSVVCVGSVLKPTWALKLRAGVFASPIRCNTGNTGILSFVKGAF